MNKNYDSKIINLNNLINKKLDKNITLCYGHFNTIHPGHLRYLEYAKSLGTELWVAVKNQENDQNIDSIFYSSDERCKGIASITFVDKVIEVKDVNLKQILNHILPNYLVLGKEFEFSQANDVRQAIEFAQKNNCIVLFHSGNTNDKTLFITYNNTVVSQLFQIRAS